jgi:hypothetical protein
MNNNFLDTENFKYLINFVFNDIKQKTNHDISNNSKYINIFKKLVQTVHEKNMNKRVSKEYLNNLVIDKCVPFIIKQVEKEQGGNNSRFLDQNSISLSERPMASGFSNSNRQSKNDFSHLTLDGQPNNFQNNTNNVVNNISGISSRNGEKIDYTDRMKEFQEDRNYNNNQGKPNQLKSINEIIGKNTNDEEKIDFMKKMQELQNERNYASQNNSMNEFQESKSLEHINKDEQLQEINNQNVEIDNSFLQQLYENNKNTTDNNFDPSSLNKLNNNYLNDNVDNVEEAYESINNLKMNIIDKSEQNKLPEYDSNIENLKEEYKSDNVNKNIEMAEKELYQSTKKYTRIPAHLIVLEEAITEGSTTSFTSKLIESLVIDKPCDVFLEFINLQNIVENGGNHLEGVNCFALQIDELNIKTSSNNNELKDTYIIPNDSFGKTDQAGDVAANDSGATSYNIKLKSNYMCTINPTELSSLTIKLFGLTSTLALLEGGTGGGKILIGLFLKKHK